MSPRDIGGPDYSELREKEDALTTAREMIADFSRKHTPRYNQDPEKGGIKFDGDKVRVELLPFDAVQEIAKILTFGARKYDDDNWLKGMSWRRVLGSALRHLFAWGVGEERDPESGELHLAHAGCCVLFLLTYQLRSLGDDDRKIVTNRSH